MIKANELRVGNLIEYKGCIIPVANIYIGQETLNDADPIPLTPEILEKCGFVRIDHIHGYTFYSLDRHGKNKRDLPPIDWYESKTLYYGFSVNHCKFLHSLQNLYYALTGEELNVQL